MWAKRGMKQPLYLLKLNLSVVWKIEFSKWRKVQFWNNNKFTFLGGNQSTEDSISYQIFPSQKVQGPQGPQGPALQIKSQVVDRIYYGRFCPSNSYWMYNIEIKNLNSLIRIVNVLSVLSGFQFSRVPVLNVLSGFSMFYTALATERHLRKLKIVGDTFCS